MERKKTNFNKIGCLNGFVLKMIAVVTMLIDHIGAVLFPSQMVFRYIGRIAFPIFVFLLVEGFLHTKNLRKYELRLIVFALLSEIPFDLAFNGAVLEFSSQNVFFTLALGLIMLDLLRYTKDRRMMELFTWLFFAVIAYLLSTDYSAGGIVFIYFFWKYREQPVIKYAGLGVFSYFFFGAIECWCLLAVIPLLLYNNERGRSYQRGTAKADAVQTNTSQKDAMQPNGAQKDVTQRNLSARLVQYAFYLFYPVHLLVLHGISLLWNTI